MGGYPRNSGRPGGIPRQRPERSPRQENTVPEEKQPENLLEKINGWRLGISIEIEPIIRGLVCLLLISFFALLQTTLFARFCPFGAIPDLMLPLVIAIAMTEDEKWGAVCGIAAAFVIEAIGSSGAALLPLLYAAAGYFCPIITALYLTDSPPVRALYTAVSGIGRSFMTLIYLALYVTDFRLGYLPGFLTEFVAHVTEIKAFSQRAFSFLVSTHSRPAFKGDRRS
jgi:hypothetical protein